MAENKCISRIKLDDNIYEVKDDLVRYILSDISEEESNSDSSDEQD